MPKIEKTDELVNWLKDKGLPEYEDTENMTLQIKFDIAVEFIRLFWPKEKIDEFEPMINGLYKDHVWGIQMIAATKSLGEGNTRDSGKI